MGLETDVLDQEREQGRFRGSIRGGLVGDDDDEQKSRKVYIMTIVYDIPLEKLAVYIIWIGLSLQTLD